MSRLRWITGLVATLLLASLFLVPRGMSAPKGTGPVPPGKILYSYNGGVWEMSGDGSGKTLVGDFSTGQPSRDTYNGHRWWIRTVNPTSEIWATPDGVTFLQVTKFSVRENGDGTITVVWMEDGHWSARPTWSNGADSFLSMQGFQWDQFPSDPLGEGPMWNMFHGIYRFDVSAAELEARYQLGLPGPAVNALDGELVVYSPGLIGGNLTIHHWSPDGTKVVYGSGLEAGKPDIWVADVGPDVTLPINAATTAPWSMPGTTTRWTTFNGHHKPTSLLSGFSVQMGFVYTVRLDGSDLVQTTPFTLNTPLRWSPDGQYLAYRRAAQTGFSKSSYDIFRIPARGGTSVRLTGDLDRNLDKRVLSWGD